MTKIWVLKVVRNFIRRLYGWGRTQTCSCHHRIHTSVEFRNFAGLYIFARLRCITFKIGNFTATRKRQEDFLLLLGKCERCTKSISFLYYCDVIEMIVRTENKKKTKQNKTNQNKKQEQKPMNPQPSSYAQSC